MISVIMISTIWLLVSMLSYNNGYNHGKREAHEFHRRLDSELYTHVLRILGSDKPKLTAIDGGKDENPNS